MFYVMAKNKILDKLHLNTALLVKLISSVRVNQLYLCEGDASLKVFIIN